MTKLTNAETIEALERTISATGANIDQKESELAELKAAHRANVRELAERKAAEAFANSTKARWDRAIKAARKAGAHVRTNIVECCRGCVGSEKLNYKGEAEKQPLAWTYGGQGQYLRWDEAGNPFTADNSRWGRGAQEAKSEMFNHSFGGAEIIAEAMRAEGFEVEWDGNEYSCVEVKF